MWAPQVRAWSFPNRRGHLTLEELDGDCAELPLLDDEELEPPPRPLRRGPNRGGAGGAAASASPSSQPPPQQQPCTHGRRTLYDLYGTPLPPAAKTHGGGALLAPSWADHAGRAAAAAGGAAAAAAAGACASRHRTIQIADRYVLPYSLTREAKSTPEPHTLTHS